jgi:hypothetical protein
MTTPPGPEPGQSLEDWVRESLLGPLPIEQASDTPAADPQAPVVPAQRAAPPSASPMVVPAQRAAPPAGSTESDDERVPDDRDVPRRRRRVALGAATGVAAAVGLAIATLTPASLLPAPEGSVQTVDATRAAARPSSPVLASVTSTPVPAAVPAAVPVAFAGRRVDVGGGWWIGVTRPYLCPVLMTVPSLAMGDTRLVRMTITIVNDTGAPAPSRDWTLRATADGSPVEMVLWPSAGFRGVPDRVLAQGERVRFLVAVRLPAQRAAVEVTAAHPSGVRAALTGRV